MQLSIENMGPSAVKKYVACYAKEIMVPENLHIDYVCNVCCTYPDLAPNERASKRNSNLSDQECIEKWVNQFYHGYCERISQRRSKMPGTIPDPAVNIIIRAGLPKITIEKTQEVIFAHRLSMSAENILGLLLEEFLFEKLSPFGWAMAWGETVKSVDFCNKNGSLLQIKNRSNSENSSSSRIRDGKPIEKWFRVNASNGRFEWNKLTSLIGLDIEGLSEKNFQEFILSVLQKNPEALAIEPENPWRNLKTED